MKYEQFSTIYNALKSASADSSLNQDNVIEAIKSQLSPDSDEYKEWEKGNFSLDHVFTTVNDFKVESKHTLLTVAFNRADLEVVNLLIKVGANVNAVGENGWTPLIIAIEKEYADPKNKGLVDLLMKANADVNIEGEEGMTPIAKAVERGNLRVFKALKEAGANVNIQAQGMSLLKWAELHKDDPKIKKEDMKEIINTLKAPSKEKGQNSESAGKQTPVNGSNKTPEKNDTNFWSEHKGKIALSVVGLCAAGAIAAYVLAYPAVALALAVLAAVILMGAGIAKVLEDPSVEKQFTPQQGV